MSILKLLFGKKEPPRVQVQSDLVWLSRNAKFDGIRNYLDREAIGESVAVLLVAHSNATYALLQKIAADYDGDTPVMSLLACDLSSEVANGLQIGENELIELIIAERHPLTYIDDHVVDGFADLLKCRCRATFFSSLDDSLMKFFGADKTKQMLRQMGLGEDEPIKSKFVAKRIRAAQKQLTKTADERNLRKQIEKTFLEDDWESALGDLK